MKNGIDRLLTEAQLRTPLRGKRLALLTNDQVRTVDGRRGLDALRDAGLDLVLLFSPEHGLAGSAEAGASIDDSHDAATGLPCISLYGNHKDIPGEAFERFDLLLIDLPDVGVRYYTYPDTAFHALDSCAHAHCPVILLDRANPLGRTVEGPLIEPQLCSIVGRYPVPVRHGLTLGEYARLAIDRFGLAPEVQLQVVAPELPPGDDPMFPDFGFPWVPPSPNLRSFEALCAYPGTCLFEGTNLSVGRGTDTPFLLVGAPWAKPEKVLELFDVNSYPGMAFRTCQFTPRQDKYGQLSCCGIQIDITDCRLCTKSFAAGFALLDAFRKASPDDFQFEHPEHFDRLLGTSKYRLAGML